jgi:hypothetical protein
MTLIEDWRAVVKKAWSLKFNALALVLTAGEVYVGATKPEGIPVGLFSLIASAVIVAAMAARLMAQKELSNGTDK